MIQKYYQLIYRRLVLLQHVSYVCVAWHLTFLCPRHQDKIKLP